MLIAVTAFAVWATSGVLIAWLLSRHGHNFWLLAVIGVPYGPLLTLIWFQAISGQPTERSSVQSSTKRGGSGWLDVLVGLDGSQESILSAQTMLDKLGPSLGRIQVASVLDHELFNYRDAFETDERRITYLQSAAKQLGLPNAEIALLSGQPDKALRDQAEADKFDLVLVAHRRPSPARLLQASTTKRLAGRSETPVLICPPTTVPS